MKKTKKVFKYIDITEYKNFEKYLEKKAENGWMLIKLNNSTMIFELGEKRSLSFDISLLDQYAPFDLPDKEIEKDYRRLCEETGWIFCANNTYFQVFYTESNSKIIPIHTDASVEYRIIKKALLKSGIANMLLICLYLAVGIMNFQHLRYDDLLSNSSLFSIIWPYAITIMWCVMMSHPIIWLLKNKLLIDKGDPLFFFSKKQVFIKNIILWGLMGLYGFMTVYAFLDLSLKPASLLLFIIPIALPAGVAIFGIQRFRKTKRTRKAKITFFVTIAAISMLVTMGSTTLLIASGLMSLSSDEPIELSSVQISLLELSDFGTTDKPKRSHLREQYSFISPLSVEYYESLGRKSKESEVSSIRTKYIELNNEEVANFIFSMFMDEEYENRDEEIQILLENNLEEDALKERNRIVKIDADLWNVDRGYYLNEYKSKIVIQKENILYILASPIDFSNREIIEICRNKLNI